MALLVAEVTYLTWQAVTSVPLDLHIYSWGGRAVLHDDRLYRVQGIGHWFTYPPFAALVFVPLSVVPSVVRDVLWEFVSLASLAIASHILLSSTRWSGRRFVLAAMLAAALVLEPVRHTFSLGQINLVLFALVVIDVDGVLRGRRWAGVGIGLATALKLTPGVFVLVLLAARKWRAAATATATFAVATGLGWLVAPNASWLYWSRLFYDTHRVGAPYISNQSPFGAALRLLDGRSHVGPWLVVVTAAALVAGVSTAASFARQARLVETVAVAGVTGLLVSPISWTHHWLWCIPGLLVLALGSRRSRAVAAIGFVVFAIGPMWWTPHFGGPDEYGWHGLTSLVANSYLIAGVGFLAWFAYTTTTTGRVRAGRT